VFDTSDLPESVNWVEKGFTNPVGDQKACGSGWAFSAIGAMEGAHFVKTGELIKLSEQQCLDCVREDWGCRGGFLEHCFDYAEMESMDLESDYPYLAISGSCFAPYKGKVKVQNYYHLEKGNTEQLKAAIV